MRGKNVTKEDAAETRGPKDQAARRQTEGRHRRSGGVAVLLAAAAIALAACSGGSHSPHVASLPAATGAGTSLGTDTGSGGGSSATTAPQANPTRLLDDWASCMHSHGDPGQADPTIDANNVIHVTLPAGYYGGLGLGGKAGTNACAVYMNRVIDAFQSGLRSPDQAQLLKFSECMRANGVPDFPDPIGDNLAVNIGSGGDLNPTNPTFQNATKLCDKRTGAGFGNSTPPPGAIVLNGVLPGAGG
jgi:hypothetical protein